ncbi:hypothetical protein EDC04DRAFT_143742 [Pisolithus marmoratus]|nr:hypothetical protein EDC04DRAFT_143742 [Pisolithus marmoratus]
MHIRNNVHRLRIHACLRRLARITSLTRPRLRNRTTIQIRLPIHIQHNHMAITAALRKGICRDAATAHPTVTHTCVSATAGARIAILFASSHSPCKIRHPIWDFHDTRFWTFSAPGDGIYVRPLFVPTTASAGTKCRWWCFGTSWMFAGTAVDASRKKLDDATASIFR